MADFLCPDGTKQPTNGKVLRKAALSEVRELARQHHKGMKIKSGQWFEVHID
jgi:hypothetical protein